MHRYLQMAVVKQILNPANRLRAEQLEQLGLKAMDAHANRSDYTYDNLVALWVNFKDICMELVTELMKLNRTQLKYYQQGLNLLPTMAR